MSDIVERLRKEGSGYSGLKLEAADEITRLREEVAELQLTNADILRKALFTQDKPDTYYYGFVGYVIEALQELK